MLYREPLAVTLRPQGLEDVVGQEHILGRDKMLRKIISSGTIPNMIFFGPSGTGKTTVANLIAKQTNKRFFQLNGTNASLSDIKAIVEQTDTLMTPNGVLLYLDEIQYFNKKQQQSLLEYIENGQITMIASTTENPYFYIYNAILSRCLVFEFKLLSTGDIVQGLLRGIDTIEKNNSIRIQYKTADLHTIATGVGGDMRKALNVLEALVIGADHQDAVIAITADDIAQLLLKTGMAYDPDGDMHYDILSAFHKSLRGSDADATLHYLARLVEAGDLISICRRLLACASEDVGLAYPMLGVMVKSLVDSAMQLGFPEARLPLANAALLIATAPKSNSVIMGIDGAISDVKSGKSGNVPDHLKDAHYGGAKKLGRGLTYQYPHAYKNHYINQQYLPNELLGAEYYVPGKNKNEQALDAYWQKVKGDTNAL